jgi:hypothetical protein
LLDTDLEPVYNLLKYLIYMHAVSSPKCNSAA